MPVTVHVFGSENQYVSVAGFEENRYRQPLLGTHLVSIGSRALIDCFKNGICVPK